MSINSSFPIGHAAISAGVNKLITQASISLINNQGDLGAVFKELGSNASLRSLATAMVTAGLVQGLDTDVLSKTNLGTGAGKLAKVQNDLVNSAIKATVRASVRTAIEGGDFEDTLKENLIYAAVDTVGASVANEIGVAAKTGKIDKATQLIAHAALGCGIGAATSGDGKGCGAGAAGAVVGELTAELYKKSVSEWIDDDIKSNQLIDYSGIQVNGVNLAKLTGGVAAALVGKDAKSVNIGARTGGNAAENNSLKLIVTGLKIAAKLAKKLQKSGKISAKDLKDAGIDEIYDALDNAHTIIDPNAVAVDKAIAILELATGLDVGFLKDLAKGTKKALITNRVKHNVEVSRKIRKNKQLLINKKNGAEFEKEITNQKRSEFPEVGEQVTIKTKKSGTKTRIDILTKDKDGKIGCNECKGSDTAPLTKNQKKAFPEIEESGGTIVGKGKPGFKGGTEIPPTKVEITRPPKE